MLTDRFIVDVVIMHVDDLVYRVFALERHKREPCTRYTTNQPLYKHSLTSRVRRHLVTAMKSVRRLQIRPTVHN